MTSATKEIASAAYQRGYSVIPVGLNKRPLIPTWKPFQERQPTKDEVREWNRLDPAGWAVVTGEVSQIIIIDFDGEQGRQTMETLGLEPHVRTGSGGYHVYLKHPGHKVKTLNSKSKRDLGERYPGMDIRADGGYAVFCGSNLAGDYEWLRDMTPDPIDVLPQDVRVYLGLEDGEPESAPTVPPLHLEAEPNRPTPDQLLDRAIRESASCGRNNAGFNLFCQLRDNDYSEGTASHIAREYARLVSPYNTKGQQEAYTVNEAVASMRAAYMAPKREPWHKVAKTIELPPRKRERPEPKEFLGLIPQPSFLDVYTHYGADMTDAPHEFHLAVGLSILSATVGNRVWFNAWGQPIYPNLWSIILAPSGFFRKSTAMRIGLNVLGLQSREKILPNDFTKEAILETLSEHAEGIVPVWEFGSMLKAMNNDYNSGLKEMLTELYDAPFYDRKTKSAGTIRIDKPAVSILAASTIDWVVDRITAGDLNSGFLARFLYWPAKEKNGWRGFDTYTAPEHTEYLQLFLENLRGVSGEAVFSKDVRHAYDIWLQGHEQEVNDQKLPASLQGFYTRIATYVLKFAVLYELAMTQDLEVGCEALGYAIALAEYLKSHLVRLMEDEIVTTKEGRELKLVKEIITREPGIDRSGVLRASKMMATKLTGLLATLVESGEVRVEVEKTSTKQKLRYYPE